MPNFYIHVSGQMTDRKCFTAYALPTTPETMNYNAVILAGVVAITGIWWVLHAVRHYPGPKVMTLYVHDDSISGVTPPSEAGELEADRKA